jgi:hypothetical protein
MEVFSSPANRLRLRKLSIEHPCFPVTVEDTDSDSELDSDWDTDSEDFDSDDQGLGADDDSDDLSFDDEDSTANNEEFQSDEDYDFEGEGVNRKREPCYPGSDAYAGLKSDDWRPILLGLTEVNIVTEIFCCSSRGEWASVISEDTRAGKAHAARQLKAPFKMYTRLLSSSATVTHSIWCLGSGPFHGCVCRVRSQTCAKVFEYLEDLLKRNI